MKVVVVTIVLLRLGMGLVAGDGRAAMLTGGDDPQSRLRKCGNEAGGPTHCHWRRSGKMCFRRYCIFFLTEKLFKFVLFCGHSWFLYLKSAQFSLYQNKKTFFELL